jgi:hypothetical protein
MYHAAATVSTLLLKLGEMSRKFANIDLNRSPSINLIDLNENEKTSMPSNETSKTNIQKSQTITTGIAEIIKNENDSLNKWSITFEQLIASLLTDNLLVEYFDAKYDLDSKLVDYKSQHA